VRYGGVDAKELLDWADTYEAGPELPRLVRKLILETSSGLVRLGFPAGKDLLYGGWDGTVNAATGSPYIPDGESLWELTTSKKVHRKANQDYQKRSLPPSVSNPSACTYVSVNLQKWPKKSDWVKERQQDGIWKDVRAYDVHDIETWLDQAPVSHAWISQQLGFEPYGIRAAESWWDAWSRATSPPCSESLVLAGRSNELKELLKRLASSEGITTIKGPSIEEVIAFVIASCLEGISNQPTWETKLAIIDDVRAWRILCEHRTALILIPHGASVTDEVHSAVRHHVIVPLAGGARADIELHRLDQQEVASVLREVAIDEKVADEYGRLARRSLMALRRRIAIKPELQQPPWAMPPISRTVRRCLLASRWSDSNQNDKEAVARIAGLAYEGFREDLLGFAKAEDPVVTRVGSTWSLISDYDAWLMLRGELQEDDIAPFKMVAVEVLKEKDPSLELPREDQMLAAVKGHVRDYSKDLRHGLAVSLALMATTGEDVRLPRGELLSDCSQSVVFELLKIANEDESCSHWASLQDVLTILCEAAPGIYLDSIRAGVTSDPPLLSGMFTDQDADMFSPSSPHSSLLWSLEILAWSPDYFGESVDLLARLEDIELGGRLANRPFESLGSIFCPWLPQTSVDADGRLSAIDGLRSRHGAISWRLMLDLLPHGQGEILMPTAEPEYREWKIEETASTRKEYWQFVEELVKRLLVDASHDHKCWIAIVEKYPYMIPPLKEKVIAGFSDYLTTCEPVGEPRVELWEALRNIIAMHEEYSGSDWSMSERDIEPLIIISKELAPENPSERWKWLFDEQFPKIPGKSRIDESQAEYEEALQEVRHNAICEIFEYSGWTGVLKFGENVQMAWGVGWALANLGIIEYEQQILELFESKESADSNMTMGYSVHRFRLEGWSWVCDLLEQDDLSPVIKANLLLATQEFPKAWKMADELGPEIAAELWRRFTPYGHGRSFEQAPYAAKRLRDVGRPFSALQLISIYMRKEKSSNPSSLKKTLGQKAFRSFCAMTFLPHSSIFRDWRISTWSAW
jgi:hypothetical protein